MRIPIPNLPSDMGPESCVTLPLIDSYPVSQVRQCLSRVAQAHRNPLAEGYTTGGPKFVGGKQEGKKKTSSKDISEEGVSMHTEKVGEPE